MRSNPPSLAVFALAPVEGPSHRLGRTLLLPLFRFTSGALPRFRLSAVLLSTVGSQDTPLTRQLMRLLHLLNVSAAALSVLLAGILLLAVWIYRRNRTEPPEQRRRKTERSPL